jgi:hypothetical protein
MTPSELSAYAEKFLALRRTNVSGQSTAWRPGSKASPLQRKTHSKFRHVLEAPEKPVADSVWIGSGLGDSRI